MLHDRPKIGNGGARKQKKQKDTTTNLNPGRNIAPPAHMHLRSQEKNLNY